jgi:hypothetical protein
LQTENLSARPRSGGESGEADAGVLNLCGEYALQQKRRGLLHRACAGSNNGFEAQDLEGVKEFFARDKANIAWINATFAKAKADGAKAIVMFVQAEFDESRFQNGAMPRQSGFTNTLDAIEAGARSFGKPVLLIHGDEHYFSIAPLRNSKGKPIPGVNKLMVYGDTLVHACACWSIPTAAMCSASCR